MPFEKRERIGFRENRMQGVKQQTRNAACVRNHAIDIVCRLDCGTHIAKEGQRHALRRTELGEAGDLEAICGELLVGQRAPHSAAEPRRGSGSYLTPVQPESPGRGAMQHL
ncbi:hypothetical protein [Burkholderia multivorans]|uniref:hypothetical protein n=1 Tax=Burkholderia multivorans TaxID=87883 RepID=UPI0015E40CD6|nr:hypothetical protein [Burkholderia multivorans]